MSAEIPKPSEATEWVAPDDQHDSEPIPELERIATPEALAAFMDERVKYGFVGRDSKKVYAPGDPEWLAAFAKEYYLQSPKELMKSGHGVCWDDTELERRWLTDRGYNPKTFFLMYAKEGGTNLPTHTFAAYEKDGTWNWFEHSFADQRGIHTYDTLDELLSDVQQKHHAYAAAHSNATDEDVSHLRIAEYGRPTFGTSPDEFVGAIIDKNPHLTAKE